MIELNSLMMCNYVLYGDEIAQIEVINRYSNTVDVSSVEGFSQSNFIIEGKSGQALRPIGLNDNWFRVFNFDIKEDLNSKEYPFTHAILTKRTGNVLLPEFKIGRNQNGYHYYSMVYISYVHELQNLYYHFTKKQLTSIKLQT